MPRAFTEAEKQNINTRLLEEGSKHFALYGLRKTRVEELATAVGISKGAFYLFYESKEALFMEVVETAERDFRQAVLATIDLPGPSPHARLFAVLDKAFSLWKTLPSLRLFTSSDYEVLARRVPAATLHAHLASDREFVEALIAHCQQAGIPIQVSPEELDGLLHTIFFASLHEDDFGAGKLSDALDILLRLTTAYCLGDVKLR